MLSFLPRNTRSRMLDRTQRSSAPAKTLLVIFVVIVYLSLPLGTYTPPSSLSDPQIHKTVSHATLAELVHIYDQARLDTLQQKGFHFAATAEKLRAPTHLPDGSTNFDPDLNRYVGRLCRFVEDYFKNTPEPIQTGARNALKDLLRRAPAKSRPNHFPATVWSTHPNGTDGVEEGFDLWKSLLPLPLSRRLLKEIGYKEDLEWLMPAKDGEKWEVIVPDDDGLDQLMSEWTSQQMARGVIGEGRWQRLWGSFEKGVLRADFFRYMSMFVKGGIYSDSDTMPISHPYLWGLGAPSILDSDIEILSRHIMQASSSTYNGPANRGSVSAYPQGGLHIPPNSTADDVLPSYVPPYYTRARRAPIPQIDRVPTTILNPEISIVVAVEWDSMIGRTLGMWRQWTWWRFKRSWPDCCFPRGLEMVQNLLVSKPFHPIMLDTLATIAGMVDGGQAKDLGPLELTGPGPFTDAVLRYLLVQYGVTPSDLRVLRGPVRVGDVLILQEEAWHAPDKAIRQLLSRVRSLGYDLLEKGQDPWLFGSGWENWQSGGKKVSYHGLTGIWKGKAQ
ncbi:hypothetical protein L486_01053 [Kwoniella mangroviensis CBS 10435]|uniref:Alpha-1,6-mannosyltransferase n=1 Tax=Kwoniella mangroviensis CBS 10435 TaxID=1331196 RepID=A0A1B9J0U6_9TREE|nr:hypothetical protein L486_01053 [Kwoniella mangroviensis CBS 10435]